MSNIRVNIKSLINFTEKGLMIGVFAEPLFQSNNVLVIYILTFSELRYYY